MAFLKNTQCIYNPRCDKGDIYFKTNVINQNFSQIYGQAIPMSLFR